MVIVAFPPGEKYAVNYTTLDQYDYGQVLRIQGLKLPKTVEVHFSTQETGGTSITRVGVTKDGVTDVLIPDSVLENGDTTQNYSIFAFVYVTDATSGKTEYRARLEVKARPKPEVPGGGDNPDIFHEAVLEVRKSAEKAEEAQRQAEGWAHGREDLPERAEDNAMYYAGKASEDAKKTAQDRAEVERLTESNTQMQGEVAKDLEEVKKLSSQAQTSATNAALSEQKSEEAATRAETAQTGAETAEDNAELAAQKTGQDKTAVEQAKKLVQQMGQEVLDNKNAVDKTAQDFTLKAQQALADVNNAGQTQTERVQTAGNAALENIKTAQNTATQAVETAKNEAIKAVQTEGTTQTGAVTAEGRKQVQAVQAAAQEIIADREQITKNKTDIAELRQNKADAIVETASGTLLNVKDSANAFFEDFSVYGKSEQVQTTGAQLLDEQLLLNINSPNYDKTTSPSGIIWYTFPVEGTVTISVKNNKNAEYLKVTAKPDKSKGVWLSHSTASASKFATLNTEDGNVYLGVNNSLTQIKAMLKNTGGVMINKGETAKSYEPYTGGKPSPSPEYPQEIVSAGRFNEDTGKYEIDVKVTGKNLFDKNKMKVINANLCKTEYRDDIIKITSIIDKANAAYAILTNNVHLRAGTTYCISGKIVKDTKIIPSFCFFKAGNIGSLIIRKDTYTATSDTYVDIGVYLGGTVATDDTIELTDIMLSIDSREKYEPYKEQTLTITSDRPLTKWDRLVKQDGQIGWLYATKYIENLAEIIRDNTPIYGTEQKYFNVLFENEKFNYSMEKVVSETGHYKVNKELYTIDVKKNTFLIKINADDTIQTAKEHLHYSVMYNTTQTEFVPLPQEQQDAIRALSTYYPSTVVSNSENMKMELSYVADTKNYTDRKIEQAVSAQVQNLANLLSLMPLSTQAAMIENDTNNILNMEVQK